MFKALVINMSIFFNLIDTLSVEALSDASTDSSIYTSTGNTNRGMINFQAQSRHVMACRWSDQRNNR